MPKIDEIGGTTAVDDVPDAGEAEQCDTEE